MATPGSVAPGAAAASGLEAQSQRTERSEGAGNAMDALDARIRALQTHDASRAGTGSGIPPPPGSTISGAMAPPTAATPASAAGHPAASLSGNFLSESTRRMLRELQAEDALTRLSRGEATSTPAASSSGAAPAPGAAAGQQTPLADSLARDLARLRTPVTGDAPTGQLRSSGGVAWVHGAGASAQGGLPRDDPFARTMHRFLRESEAARQAHSSTMSRLLQASQGGSGASPAYSGTATRSGYASRPYASPTKPNHARSGRAFGSSVTTSEPLPARALPGDAFDRLYRQALGTEAPALAPAAAPETGTETERGRTRVRDPARGQPQQQPQQQQQQQQQQRGRTAHRRPLAANKEPAPPREAAPPPAGERSCFVSLQEGHGVVPTSRGGASGAGAGTSRGGGMSAAVLEEARRRENAARARAKRATLRAQETARRVHDREAELGRQWREGRQQQQQEAARVQAATRAAHRAALANAAAVAAAEQAERDRRALRAKEHEAKNRQRRRRRQRQQARKGGVRQGASSPHAPRGLSPYAQARPSPAVAVGVQAGSSGVRSASPRPLPPRSASPPRRPATSARPAPVDRAPAASSVDARLLRGLVRGQQRLEQTVQQLTKSQQQDLVAQERRLVKSLQQRESAARSTSAEPRPASHRRHRGSRPHTARASSVPPSRPTRLRGRMAAATGSAPVPAPAPAPAPASALRLELPESVIAVLTRASELVSRDARRRRAPRPPPSPTTPPMPEQPRQREEPQQPQPYAPPARSEPAHADSEQSSGPRAGQLKASSGTAQGTAPPARPSPRPLSDDSGRAANRGKRATPRGSVPGRPKPQGPDDAARRWRWAQAAAHRAATKQAERAEARRLQLERVQEQQQRRAARAARKEEEEERVRAERARARAAEVEAGAQEAREREEEARRMAQELRRAREERAREERAREEREKSGPPLAPAPAPASAPVPARTRSSGPKPSTAVSGRASTGTGGARSSGPRPNSGKSASPPPRRRSRPLSSDPRPSRAQDRSKLRRTREAARRARERRERATEQALLRERRRSARQAARETAAEMTLGPPLRTSLRRKAPRRWPGHSAPPLSSSQAGTRARPSGWAQAQRPRSAAPGGAGQVAGRRSGRQEQDAARDRIEAAKVAAEVFLSGYDAEEAGEEEEAAQPRSSTEAGDAATSDAVVPGAEARSFAAERVPPRPLWTGGKGERSRRSSGSSATVEELLMEDEGDLPPAPGPAAASGAALRATWTEGAATISNPLFDSTASSGRWSGREEGSAAGTAGAVGEQRWRHMPAAPAPSRASPTPQGPSGASTSQPAVKEEEEYAVGEGVSRDDGSAHRWSRRSEPRRVSPSAEVAAAAPHAEPEPQWAPLHEGRATGMGSPTPRGLPSARGLGEEEEEEEGQAPWAAPSASAVSAVTAEARVRMNAQVPISATHANARPAVEGGPLLLDLDPEHAEFQAVASLFGARDAGTSVPRRCERVQKIYDAEAAERMRSAVEGEGAGPPRVLFAPHWPRALTAIAHAGWGALPSVGPSASAITPAALPAGAGTVHGAFLVGDSPALSDTFRLAQHGPAPPGRSQRWQTLVVLCHPGRTQAVDADEVFSSLRSEAGAAAAIQKLADAGCTGWFLEGEEVARAVLRALKAPTEGTGLSEAATRDLRSARAYLLARAATSRVVPAYLVEYSC